MSNADDALQITTKTASELAAKVYADVASPAARRVGTALETLFKVGLSPVSLLDWGFEQSKEWLTLRIAARLSATPVEFQQAPPSQIGVPLLLAIASSPDSEEMRELYSELLMKAMDTRTVSDIHPSYVSVLGQLTPQEALVMMSFRSRKSDSLFIDRPRTSQYKRPPSIETKFHDYCVGLGLQHPDTQVWLENLLRLRLLNMHTYTDAQYSEGDYERPWPSVETNDERHLSITEYGMAFLEACAPKEAAQ